MKVKSKWNKNCDHFTKKEIITHPGSLGTSAGPAATTSWPVDSIIIGHTIFIIIFFFRFKPKKLKGTIQQHFVWCFDDSNNNQKKLLMKPKQRTSKKKKKTENDLFEVLQKLSNFSPSLQQK